MNPNHYPPHLQKSFDTVATAALRASGIEVDAELAAVTQLNGHDAYVYPAIGDARAAIITSMVTGEVATLDLSVYEV